MAYVTLVTVYRVSTRCEACGKEIHLGTRWTEPEANELKRQYEGEIFICTDCDDEDTYSDVE